MKKLISVLASICIMLSICLVPTTVIADAASVSPKVEESDYVAVLENEGSSGQSGYTYNAPEPGEFLIENAFGTISIADGTPVLQFAGYTVTMPSVDYYKIVDNNGNLRYYQADVLINQTIVGNFVYIAIYVENGIDYTLHIQYMIETGEKMYNTVVPLSAEQYAYFDQISISFCVGDEDISDRLKLSARIYTYGSFEQNVATFAYNSVEPMALNPIVENTYDSYTNDDGIIKTYVSDYFGQSHIKNGYITDDAIVNIIPKALCFVPGEHIYVGKEYGFFIRVVTDSLFLNDFAVDVLVFDITHTSPSFPSDTIGSTKIEPLFQYKYRATSGNSTGFDPSLSQIVYPHTHYDYLEYLLSETGFKVTLNNVDELNPGDVGYEPLEDSGAFITVTQLITHGVGAKARGGSVVRDTALFTFGFIPVVGQVLSTATYLHDLHNGFGNGAYLYTRDAADEDDPYGEIQAYETNNTDQISVRGNLIKALSTRSISNPNDPEFIPVGGSVEAKYVISRKSGSTNNKIRITTSVSVSVVEDNSQIINFPFGLGTLMTGDIVEYGRATGTYETGDYKRLNDITPRGFLNITIPAGTQRYIIKMTAVVGGSYKIITSGSSGDPHFYITNATKGTSTIAATDDISSMDRNAELIIDLIAGDVYYIEAFNYNQYHSYTLRIGCNPMSNETMTVDIPYYVSVPAGVYHVVKFTPTENGYYEIRTNKTHGDPMLFVFMSSGGLLASDDDSGGGFDACIDIYLTAGVTFYIVVHEFHGYALDLSITVTRRE